MQKNIIIETDRLILRQWNLNNVNDMVEGLNNLNVSKWLAYPLVVQRYDWNKNRLKCYILR